MTTYLEPPLQTLYHSNFRGLLRFCNIEDGYLLTLTVQTRDDCGRWHHLTTEIASPAFFAQEFEALVHTIGADEDFHPHPLPAFVVVDGQPTPVPPSQQVPEPVDLRHSLSILLEHYFQDETQHFESTPIDQRQNHIFRHWVTVLNCLDNGQLTPEALVAEPPVTRVPLWLTLLGLALTLPTLLYLPATFIG